MKRATIFLITITSIVLATFAACDIKPTEPVNDNPFDVENAQTGGDPFQLTAKIAGGGITLEWNKPNFKDLQSYKIYRSQQQTNDYAELGTAAANMTQYVDKAIENGHSYWYLVTVVNTQYKETSRTNEAAVNINTEPVLVINGGAEYTVSKTVFLTILAISAQRMMLSNGADFSGAAWETYTTSKNWTLISGDGQKTVFMKVKYNSTESTVVQKSILPQAVSNYSLTITDSDTSNTLDVILNIRAQNATQMMISNDSLFSGVNWEDYRETKQWHLDYSRVIDYRTRVYAKFKNDFDMETQPIQDKIYLQISSGIKINNDAQYTPTRTVNLTLFSENADQMMLSNNVDFSDANWENFMTTKSWMLPTGNGPFTVYAKFRNASGLISKVYSDDVLPQPMNPSVEISSGAEYSATRDVPLTLGASGSNLQMKLSEDSTFSGVSWQTYSSSPGFQLSTGDGLKKVFAKIKNDFEIESNIVLDEINPQPINPAISIADGAQYSPTRDVQLTLSASGTNLQMKLSEDSTFTGIHWQTYSAAPAFQLSTGDGTKKVFAKFLNDFEIESSLIFDEINPQPINPSISIAGGAQYSQTRDVQLTLSASGSNLQMKLSEDSTFSGINWQAYSAAPNFQLSIGDGTKKVFAKIKNDFEIETANEKDEIILDSTPPSTVLTVTPDSGITNETQFQFDPTSSSDNLCPEQDLRVRYDYENDGSYDTDWQQLVVNSYQFTVGGGNKTVKMQLKDGAGWQVETTKDIFVNTRPQASFTATQDNGNYKLYHFDASASTDYEDGENIEYRWDFDGDGSWDTSWLTQDTISYEYLEERNYNVKVSVRDGQGLTAEKTAQITTIPQITDQDGNVYKIVKIGNQWWMAENLKVTHYRNGDAIPNVTDNTEWTNLSTGAWCSYNNDNGNIDTYGLLYNWYAAADSRSIAPTGWHVPTDFEYTTLENYLIASGYNWDGTTTGNKIAKSLATKTGWNSFSGAGAVGNDMVTNNASGFSALPGGYRYYFGTFIQNGIYGYWWNSTAASTTYGRYRYLGYDYSGFVRSEDFKQDGVSVRLIRD